MVYCCIRSLSCKPAWSTRQRKRQGATHASPGLKYMAGEYHESDFNVEDIAAEAQAQLEKQAEEARLLHSPSDASGFPASNWEDFHAVHNSAKFFKPRRYMPLAFPELMQPGIHVVELGCGAGASIIPVLQANSSCRATVSDVSATAISNLVLQAESMGISQDRLFAFVGDATDPGHCAHASMSITTDRGPVDIVMLVFTLSAVPPDAMAAALQTAWALLRPGGVLLVRDYGQYDMTALRFPPEQRIEDGLYFRYVKYARVKLVNKKKGKEMRRVFIQGKFFKAG